MIVTGINLIGLITMLTGYFGIRKRNYPVLSARWADYLKFIIMVAIPAKHYRP